MRMFQGKRNITLSCGTRNRCINKSNVGLHVLFGKFVKRNEIYSCIRGFHRISRRNQLGNGNCLKHIIVYERV